jgi:transcriptional regulator with XRE-family HTH domain
VSANEIDVHVGTRLRERREAMGVSQGKLGKHLGLTFSQVQKYEKGTNRIGAGRLHQMAGFLGVPVSYFYEGLGEGKGVAQSGGDARDPMLGEEIRVLNAAYSAIADQGTRASVLALVKSLANEDKLRR